VLVAGLPPARGFAQAGDGAERAEGGAGHEAPRAAIAHYKKGRELYLAGRYREAVVELEAAVALDPESPNLLYNLARVYELLGEIDTSIAHYKHYRELLPPSEVEERARVDGTLQRLEGARTQVPDDGPTQPAPPPPKMERGVADATFWVFTAVSAAAFVSGAALGVAALNAEKDAKGFVLEDSDSIFERRKRVSHTDHLALGSDLCLLAGAVLGTTAILLFALREKPVQSPPRAVLDFGAGPKGGFLLLRGHL
jgi:tetratricopeptide (TPR) repeat protein